MGVYWGIDNYRPFNYLSDFAENRLEGVHVSQDVKSFLYHTTQSKVTLRVRFNYRLLTDGRFIVAKLTAQCSVRRHARC